MNDNMNESTLAQHNMRYDHSILSKLPDIVDFRKHTLSVQAVQASNGFFDAQGMDLAALHQFERLPNGDANTIGYWASLQDKNYWYDHNQVVVNGLPTGYGIVTVISNSYAERWVIFKAQPTNGVYYRSMNANTLGAWTKLIDENDDAIAQVSTITAMLGGFSISDTITSCGLPVKSSLADVAAAMDPKTILVLDAPNQISSGLPMSDLATLVMIKHSSYRCVMFLIYSGGDNTTTNYFWLTNWRTDTGLRAWRKVSVSLV